MPRKITCAFCHQRFSAEERAAACHQCSLFGTGGCHKVRCPHCGYEMPPPARLPGLLAGLLARITRKRAARGAQREHTTTRNVNS